MEIRSNLLAVYPAVVMIKKEPDPESIPRRTRRLKGKCKGNRYREEGRRWPRSTRKLLIKRMKPACKSYAQEKNSHNHGQQDEAPEVLVLRGKASNQARRSKGTNQRLALPKMIRMADSMTEKMAKTPLLPLVTASWSSEVDGYLTEINRVGCLRLAHQSLLVKAPDDQGYEKQRDYQSLTPVNCFESGTSVGNAELINQNPSQHPPPPLKLKISRFISQRGREAEAGFKTLSQTPD
ncbi:hypothetical protein BY996DRAFT_6621506 [Phakopsora pachyrhizi]|nr:hypothetical protein BY996DRAFT_6621506 [Phakopsora pachyrhizi]